MATILYRIDNEFTPELTCYCRLGLVFYGWECHGDQSWHECRMMSCTWGESCSWTHV